MLLPLFKNLPAASVLPNPVPTNSQPFPSAMPSLAEKMDGDNGEEDDDRTTTPTVNQGLGLGAAIAIGSGALVVIGATLYARRRVVIQKSMQDLAPLDADTGESQGIWLEETPSRTRAEF